MNPKLFTISTTYQGSAFKFLFKSTPNDKHFFFDSNSRYSSPKLQPKSNQMKLITFK
jgi:hypothetical protein